MSLTIFKIYLFVCVSVCFHVIVYRGQKKESALPGAGIFSGWKLIQVGVWNLTPVLWKSRKYS